MAIEVNDVIEVTLRLELEIPEEDEDKREIYVHDYNQKYNITYRNLRNDDFCDIDFTVDAGCIPCFSDIESYLQEDLIHDYEEITEYELLESDSSDIEYQTAKIRVKSLAK